MQETVFVVKCERVPRKQAYKLWFPFNNQVVERIKELLPEQRKWHSMEKTWELKTPALLSLIKRYKGSNKIHFDFGNEDSRKVFIQQIKKIELSEKQKKRLIADLEVKKQQWVKWKDQLEIDYENYSEKLHSVLKNNINLYPHQIVAAMFLHETKSALISHEMGLGKANPVDSKLLTPTGWIKMGDINVGDEVIGSDGKFKKILAVYPQGKKDIYEIFFNDGTSAQSCDEHLWNVNTQIRNWRGNPYKTKTLREIIDDGLKYKNGNNKHYIPIVKPIQFNEKKLNIHPYVLGCLLGDGSITTKSAISFSSIDNEIINEIKINIPSNHKVKLKQNSNKDYYITGNGNNKILKNLKYYNLQGCNSHTKFIPDDYKFSSIQQRLELLQGILDTDGHSRKDSIVELTLASKRLIEDVQFIVQSLGGIGRIKKKNIKYNGENKLYWRINIKLPVNFIPFKLKRKINTFKPPSKYLPNRAIVDIKYVGKKDAQCILIDSEDHLYSIDNCVLTHNTLSSIAYVELNNFEKVFVITPNSLKFNYCNEVEKFTNSKAHIINWKKNQYSIDEAKYIIVNYDYFNPSDKNKVLDKWKKLGLKVIDAVICDEAHKLKNTKSNTYKNFKSIFKDNLFRNKKVSKIFLTGTPAPNRAYELYSILNQISPLDFATKKYFYEYYCGMTYDIYGFGGWITDIGQSKLEELYHKIAPYTHRKRKKDVLTDLPDKIYQRVMLEMTDKDYKVYEDIEEGVINEYIKKPLSNQLTIMLKLRQYTSHLKVIHLIDLINNILETGEKIVIVDNFKESLLRLKEKFGGIAELHTGDQSVEERAEIVKTFQDPNSSMKIFLGSIQTCNYGLTLTAASKLFIISLPYVPGEYDQVADRLHRIGQKDVVNIYPLIFPDTIDEYVYSSIESKRKEIVKVIDNEDYKTNITNSVMDEVIKKIMKKYGRRI